MLTLHLTNSMGFPETPTPRIAKPAPYTLVDEDGKIILQDDFRSDEHMDIVENNPNFPSQTTINVEHSTDVVIGPVTQFHGPVTIVQGRQSCEIKPGDFRISDKIINTHLAQSDSVSSDKSETSLKKEFLKNKKLSIMLTSLTVLLIIITATTVIAIKPKHISEQSDNNIVPSEDLETSPNKLESHLLIDRHMWGGREPLNFTRPLKHPVGFVIISHTAGVFCKTITRCSSIMVDIQSLHVSKLKSPDIGYNFLIGGDGNIYVGRGWDLVNFHDVGCIGISFIGNYVYDHLTDAMIEATQLLLQQGIELGKLTDDYRLVSHNQTFATQSPGDNVYSVIKNWKHFKEGHFVSWS